MTINITRYSPNTCGCVLEIEYDYDVPQDQRQGKFLLLNTVCDDHKHLASTTHRPEHSQLSRHAMDLIDVAKNVNLAGVDAIKVPPGSARRAREKEKLRAMVIQFNNDITEEWNELVTQVHAFDQNIHDIVMGENVRFNIAQNAIIEHFKEKGDSNNNNLLRKDEHGNHTLRSDRAISFSWEGKAPGRMLKISAVDTNNGQSIIDEEDTTAIQSKISTKIPLVIVAMV